MIDKTRLGASMRDFIIQQGVMIISPELCPAQFSALMFQPKLVFAAALAGCIFQSPEIFLGLGLLLWWGAIVPKWNVFDLLYNRTAGRSAGAWRLPPAPSPRRFAQGLAGAFALSIAILLFSGRVLLAAILEIVFMFANVSVLLRRFCAGSYIFNLFAAPGQPGRRQEYQSTCAGKETRAR
jgi:hypothetical protein